MSASEDAQDTCLILSATDDPHVTQVVEHFAQRNEWRVIILDTKMALGDLQLVLGFGPESEQWTGTLNGLPLASIRSIWYRRPERPKPPADTVMHPGHQALAAEEMRSLLQNLYRILPVRILPNPAHNREADHKLWQLKIARSVGLSVPRTAVGTIPDVLDMLPASVDDLCIKPLSAFHWWTDPASEFALRSARVTRAELDKHISDVVLCPVLLQEYVAKRYEWRVTVVGRRVFACRIDSQRVAAAREDWRLAEPTLLEHQLLDLPKELEGQLLRYLQCFGLEFGAFDLIESPNGQFVFLECNPNGQWLWIEELTSAPISEAIADLLCS